MEVPHFGFRAQSRNLMEWLKTDERFKTYPDRGDEHVILMEMKDWLSFHGLPQEWAVDTALSRIIGAHLRSLGFHRTQERVRDRVFRAWWKNRHATV